MSIFEVVESGDVEKVRAILSNTEGVGVNTPSPEGESLLMIAAKNGHKEIVQLLLKYGADPNLVTPVSRIPRRSPHYKIANFKRLSMFFRKLK
jgi:hypothetical protein